MKSSPTIFIVCSLGKIYGQGHKYCNLYHPCWYLALHLLVHMFLGPPTLVFNYPVFCLAQELADRAEGKNLLIISHGEVGHHC